MIDDTATKGDLQMMESFATQLHMKSPSKQATPSKDDGCVKNLLSKMVDDESIPGITSLSERSTSSTDVSSSYYQGEGSERWDLDDDDDELSYDALLVSSLNQQQQLTALNVVVEQPASTPVAENDGNNEQLQTIFEGTESVVEPAVVVESSSTVDIVDLVLPKVSWGTVEMRIYPIVLGDHPETWQGPPVRYKYVCMK